METIIEKTLGELLESVPPGAKCRVADIRDWNGYSHVLQTPEVTLHCDKCEGDRFFSTNDEIYVSAKFSKGFLHYSCKNCSSGWKLFSLIIYRENDNADNGLLVKLGEMPAFGPPLPARMISLLGEDGPLFLKGRRSESQGLGIGAFSYYRRVVENQKNRLLAEIEKAALKLNADSEFIKKIQLARDEIQFTKALDFVKDALPDGLLIDGHNPLKLLHKALSGGLHQRDDAHCLELATSIRVVLSELSERLAIVLKENRELKKAITKLISV